MGESSSINAASSENAPSDEAAPPADPQPASDAAPATDDAGAEPAPPLNRAARRGKPNANDSAHGQERGFGHRARAAQGRRFNPIRRTG